MLTLLNIDVWISVTLLADGVSEAVRVLMRTPDVRVPRRALRGIRQNDRELWHRILYEEVFSASECAAWRAVRKLARQVNLVRSWRPHLPRVEPDRSLRRRRPGAGAARSSRLLSAPRAAPVQRKSVGGQQQPGRAASAAMRTCRSGLMRMAKGVAVPGREPRICGATRAARPFAAVASPHAVLDAQPRTGAVSSGRPVPQRGTCVIVRSKSLVTTCSHGNLRGTVGCSRQGTDSVREASMS